VQIDRRLLATFAPLPAQFDSERNPITGAKVDLGRMLFFDARLSRNQDHSCNSCHDLGRYGVDGERLSHGHQGQLGKRNAPTVYNAAGNIAQFWDGRAATVEDQAKGPMMNPVEMAMPGEQRIVATLSSIPEYVRRFRAAFPGEKQPLSLDNAARAIGAFERRLVTPSRFDRYLQGDEAALTAGEKQGLKRFIDAGCPSCHNGPGVGGGSYERLGAAVPYPDEKDLGRYALTQKDEDRMVFRVPGLRDVAMTAPYFHDGSVPRLQMAVHLMAEHQLGKTLSPSQTWEIVTFLNALTGDVPAACVAPPHLPPSTRSTPRPDPR